MKLTFEQARQLENVVEPPEIIKQSFDEEPSDVTCIYSIIDGDLMLKIEVNYQEYGRDVFYKLTEIWKYNDPEYRKVQQYEICQPVHTASTENVISPKPERFIWKDKKYDNNNKAR